MRRGTVRSFSQSLPESSAGGYVNDRSESAELGQPIDLCAAAVVAYPETVETR